MTERSASRFWPHLLLAIAFGPAASAQDVHIVGSGPGADFSTLTEAIGAASDGDVLLVRPGSYQECPVIEQKSLFIHADTGALVEVAGFEIRNVQAGQVVAIRGVDVPPLVGCAVSVHDNQGVIWFEDAELYGSAFFLEAVRVENCTAVLFRNCRLEGLAPDDLTLSVPALNVLGSSAYVFEGEVRGADGRVVGSHGGCPSAGHPGVVVDNGTLWLYGTAIRGGNGHDGTVSACVDGADGGSGVRSTGAASEVYSLGASVAGGDGGTGASGGNDGDPGDPFVSNGAGPFLIAQSPRYETVPSPVRDDESLVATETGQPGDRIWTFFSVNPLVPATGSAWDGPFVIGRPRGKVSKGTTASGTLTQTFVLGDLGPGIEAIPAFAQSIMQDASTNRFVASAPTLVLLLDRAY